MVVQTIASDLNCWRCFAVISLKVSGPIHRYHLLLGEYYMQEPGDSIKTAEPANRKVLFRVIFSCIVIFSWSLLFICIMEFYEQLRWSRIRQTNEIILEKQMLNAKFTQAFTESLWEEPWSTYKKNQEVSFVQNGKRFQIKTNNLGLRDDYTAVPKPEGLFRILCIGGSTTVEGWTNETTYPSLLENKLKEAFPKVHLEVVNWGVSGVTSRVEFEKMSDYLRLNPDLIIEYNGVNDICWLYFPYIDRNTVGWKRLARRSRFLNNKLNWYLLPGKEAIRNYFENTTIKNLNAVNKAAGQKKVPVLFCSFSYPDVNLLSKKEREYFEFDLKGQWQGKYITFRSYRRMVEIYNQSLKDYCQRQGIPYVPVAENLRGGMNYFVDISHLTDDGITRKAGIVYTFLKDYLPARFRVFRQ